MKRFVFAAVFVILCSYWISISSKPSALAAPAAQSDLASATPTATATANPSSTPVPPSATPTQQDTSLPTITPIIPPTTTPLAPGQVQEYLKPRLEAFISVPSGPVPQPYIILSGYQTFSGTNGPVSVSGTVGDRTFECASSPCTLDFPQTGNITFHAHNAHGDVSEDNQASVLVTGTVDGYYLSIASLGKFVIFSDACANLWGSSATGRPGWSNFPQNPDELNTQKVLHYLASRLMASKVVDTSGCPGGGLDGSAPNPCGLAQVHDKMIAWQNQYDFDIWLTGRDQHIPPMLLKSLLEIESQFWPITQRMYLDEIGLGQINQLGVDVLLRTNPELYQRICSAALYKCDLPYVSLGGLDRALLRGTLALALDASCRDCQYGIDLNKASESIPLIAQVLYSNCTQAQSLLNMHHFTASYNDNWKFTMVSYHSGFGCLQSALDKVAVTNGEIGWADVMTHITCPGAIDYIDRLWTSMETFDTNKLIAPTPEVTVQFVTPTPLPPTPTPVLHLSSAHLVVKVFVDQNGDGIRQDNEAVDNVQVNLEIAGSTRIMITQYGMVVFDLTGLEIGSRGKVSLPGLYRSAPIIVPESGDLPVVFIFIKPVLPTRLP